MHPDGYIQIIDRKKDIIISGGENICKEHLARFKAPKYLVFGELPKTATGKIQKYKLRELEWGDKKNINH